MSIDALRSALAMERQEGLGPKHRLVLLALADHANAAGEAFLSRPAIEAETWLDRKTVSTALGDLKQAGLIVDTGRRRGRTAQVIVWSMPWIEHRHKQAQKRAGLDGEDYSDERQPPGHQRAQGLPPDPLTAEQAQKRNSTENGPVTERGPKTDSKRPVFPGKEAQKRATEPPTGFNPPTGEVTPLHGARAREDAQPAQQSQAKAKAQGKRLPDDWQPSPDLLAWARKDVPGVDLALEHEKFVDHWRAQPGAKGRKADWDATWRNWMRRAPGFDRPAYSQRQPEAKGAASRILS